MDVTPSERFVALHQRYATVCEENPHRRQKAVAYIVATVWARIEAKVNDGLPTPNVLATFDPRYKYIGGTWPCVLYTTDFEAACEQLARETPEITWKVVDMHAMSACGCVLKDTPSCHACAIGASWTWDANLFQDTLDVT